VSKMFQPIGKEAFVNWVFDELEVNASIFGIPRELFFVPSANDRFTTRVYNHHLETPFGVAAGPHSQMAQNIITAWLCGARFIELKTVQTLDEIEVSKPCIDMRDEGYNCEWSQELKVEQSFDEYVRAWVLIHALHKKLGFSGERPGVNFNMSVGYNMEGILKPNMQWYLEHMRDASDRCHEYIDLAARYVPEVRDMNVPEKISDNVTLSTMHGCPPDEIEKISAYLLTEWHLHTSVKLNPTLLGPERLRGILNDTLGYKEVVVPDIAFEHDLKYETAVPMLQRLSALAKEKELQFGVKLTNTLEVENTRGVFAESEKMMYMSGRSLHAVSVNLAARLGEAFDGQLMMSFSAGADAFNVADLLASGMKTITVCSDILKPGSYLRLNQYLENTSSAMEQAACNDLSSFICHKAGHREEDPRICALENLKHYAQAVLEKPQFKKDAVDTSRIKTSRSLGLFDCIMAPCTDECPVNQKVPQYMALVREGRFDEAVEITRKDNPLPTILGRACNHLCENLCVRTHYDQPLAIREMKRFIMSRENDPHFRKKASARNTKVAVIGAGPCGLSIAYFLAQAGYPVTLFERRAYAGGMVSGTIPSYRAAQVVIDQDLNIIRELGVEILFNQQAGKDFTIKDLREQGFNYIAIGVGAQRGRKLGVEGEDSEGVLDALDFLRSVREDRAPELGEKIGIIGGGDVAMDCARSAWRLTGGKVSIIYRRTIEQMPAAPEEIHGVLEEGIDVVELVKPLRVIEENGKMTGLVGLRMKLGDKDASGRRRPVDIPDSEFTIPLDNLIVAISQEPDLDFLGDLEVEKTKKGYLAVNPETMETSVSGIYAGGDISINGPESIVKALGDGRKIAEHIQSREEARIVSSQPVPADSGAMDVDMVDLLRRKAHRKYRVPILEIPPSERKNFNEVEQTLTEESAQEEASRCFECHKMCSICVSVCPNRALMTYKIEPFKITIPELRNLRGDISFAGSHDFEVAQKLQVAVLTDFCNGCGNCSMFCPTSGKPSKDKPRLYLNRSEFDAQNDNAFMLLKQDGKWGMRGRFNGETHEIVMDNEIDYRTPKLNARLDPVTLHLNDSQITGEFREGDTVTLDPCGVMVALLKGLTGSLSHLPVASA